MNKPTQKIIGSVDLLELLDLEERGELADHLDLKRPEKLDDKAFQDEILSISATTLLEHILQLRQPMIRMLQDIYAFLSRQEVKGRSTTRAVILPRAEKDLKILFDEALTGVIATALDRRRRKASLEAIAQRIGHLTNLLNYHVGTIEPSLVQCETSESLALQEVSGLEAIAHQFRQFREVYHQHDIACVEALYSELQEISTKLEQLNSAAQHKKSAHAGAVQEVLIKHVYGMRIVEAKLYDMRGSRTDSYDATSPTQCIYGRDWDGLLEEISTLKEIIFAACEFEESATSLYDFLNLEMWRDRWRIYELWMLTHLIDVFERVGFEVDISARVQDEVWDLKFTKDDSPIATLLAQGVTLEIYYQLYEKNAQGGDMPDIAIKEQRGGYVFVLDPKYGRSYRRGELGELAERYAKAFSAKLTIIHNFYQLPTYDYLTVSEDPACMVVSDIAPDTKNLGKLDRDIILALDSSWLSARTVMMVDVSGSTSGVRQRLVNAVERVCEKNQIRSSGSSLLVLYSDKMEVCLPLRSVRNIKDLIFNTAGGGTSLSSALQEVISMLAAEVNIPSIILVFTDDDPSELSKGVGDLVAIVDKLRAMNTRIEVFEVTKSDHTTLSDFTENNQIKYERIW